MGSAKFFALSCLFANSWATKASTHRRLPSAVTKASVSKAPKKNYVLEDYTGPENYEEFKERLTNLEIPGLALHKFNEYGVGVKHALKVNGRFMTYENTFTHDAHDRELIDLKTTELSASAQVNSVEFMPGNIVFQRRRKTKGEWIEVPEVDECSLNDWFARFLKEEMKRDIEAEKSG